MPAPKVRKLTAGKLYAIEIPEAVSQEALDRFEEYLAPFREKLGCEFLILDAGARLRDPSCLDEDALDEIAERVAIKLAMAARRAE